MSDNKVNNQLDFRNVKNSQLNGSQIERAEFSELQSSKRVFNTNTILKDAYTHFIQTLDGSDRPIRVEYWQATSPAIDKLAVSADIAGSKAGTYFTLQEYITKKTHVFYFVVSGSGTAPGIGDIETAINIVTNDAASVVALAVQSAINLVSEFTASRTSILSSFVNISYLQFGETSGVDVGTSGFMVTRTKEGTSFQVGEVDLDYNVDGHPIYGGNVLKGLLYNPYTASFDVERDEITVTTAVDLSPLISKDPTIYNVAMTTANTEYSLTLPVDTKRFQMNIRDHLSPYTVSYTSSGTYLSRSYGVIYEESGLEVVVGKDTLYFTAKKDNMIMEIIAWK